MCPKNTLAISQYFSHVANYLIYYLIDVLLPFYPNHRPVDSSVQRFHGMMRFHSMSPNHRPEYSSVKLFTRMRKVAGQTFLLYCKRLPLLTAATLSTSRLLIFFTSFFWKYKK